MQSKLEMMFADNRRSTQCRLTHLERLSPVDIISSRQNLERQFAGIAQSDSRIAGRAWLADIEVDDPSILALFQFSQAIGPTANEWDHYQALLERYYEQYEAFLREKNLYENLRGRTAPLELKLLNAGESIARDLLVKMTLPEGILLYTENDYPKKPEEPLPPDRPAPVYERMLNGKLDQQKVAAAIPYAEPTQTLITDLKVQRGEGYDVSFRVPKLPQQGRLVVGKFYVVFPSIETAKNFSIPYKVFADGPAAVKEGTLSLKVTDR